MNALLLQPPADAVSRLRRSMQLRRQADIDEMQALSQLAAEHSWSSEDELDVTNERAVRLGADGSPLVGEFLPLEVASIKGISATAATWLIRDVINLQSRHPVMWGCVCRGEVQPYQAFQLVQLAAKYELTQGQAHELDTALAPKLGALGWARLMRLARGLIAILAADAMKAAADRAREARFCRIAPADEPVVSELWARLDTTDAQQLEATVSALAKALASLGDSDDLDIRRAKALGLLATPQRATELLGGRDDARYLPHTRVYLHLPYEMLTQPKACADPSTSPDVNDRTCSAGGANPSACKAASGTKNAAGGCDSSISNASPNVGPGATDAEPSACDNASEPTHTCHCAAHVAPGTCAEDCIGANPSASEDAGVPVDSVHTRDSSTASTGHCAAHSDADATSLPEAPPSGIVARSETLGPIVKAQLAQLFGNHRITVTPVVHTVGEPAVDCYEIPKRIAESVRLRDMCEVFPYSSRMARRLDLDHTIPFVEGAAQQTRPDNLGPLTRRVPRAKTARQWQVRQPANGVFWWRSPRGQNYRVTSQGTTDLHDWSVGERSLRWHLDDRPPPT